MRSYFLSYIEWRDDRGRGYDRSHTFQAKTDADARTLADEHLRGVKTSGLVVLRCVETRRVPYRRRSRE